MTDGTILGVVVIAAAFGALYVASRRAITIAELEIDHGTLRVVRGGVVPPVLADLRDIARTPPIERAHIRILRSSGRAEVVVRGNVSATQAQRIRNVVGSVPLARLVNAARK